MALGGISMPNGYWQGFDSTRIYYHYWPAFKPRATIYLVHGLGEHAGRYDHVASFFNQHDFSVIAFDLRGHGLSEGKRGHAISYEALLKDIDLLFSESQLLSRNQISFLYGHSLGGNLVLNYALRRKSPFRGVIATSPWLSLAKPPSLIQEILANIEALFFPGIVIKTGLDAAGLSRDKTVVTKYINDELVHDYLSVGLFKEINKAADFAKANAPYFPLPLLLVHGTDDPITSYKASKEFAKKVPHCTFKSWPGLLHETHNESCYKEVLAFNLKWLEQLLTNK